MNSHNTSLRFLFEQADRRNWNQLYHTVAAKIPEQLDSYEDFMELSLYLDSSAKVSFVRSCQLRLPAIVKNGYHLSYVLGILPSEERLNFLKMCGRRLKKIVTDTEELIILLYMLSSQEKSVLLQFCFPKLKKAGAIAIPTCAHNSSDIKRVEEALQDDEDAFFVWTLSAQHIVPPLAKPPLWQESPSVSSVSSASTDSPRAIACSARISSSTEPTVDQSFLRRSASSAHSIWSMPSLEGAIPKSAPINIPTGQRMP